LDCGYTFIPKAQLCAAADVVSRSAGVPEYNIAIFCSTQLHFLYIYDIGALCGKKFKEIAISYIFSAWFYYCSLYADVIYLPRHPFVLF